MALRFPLVPTVHLQQILRVRELKVQQPVPRVRSTTKEFKAAKAQPPLVVLASIVNLDSFMIKDLIVVNL